MCETISDKFIRDMLTDRRTLQRALSRSEGQDCLGPHTRATKLNVAPVFRRGCTDNVCSLHLFNQLRSVPRLNGMQDMDFALQLRVKEAWNSSTVAQEQPEDLMVKLLKRQLRRKGFTDNYEKSYRAVVHNQSNCMRKQREEHAVRRYLRDAESARRQREEVVQGEKTQRTKIRDQEKEKRRSIQLYILNQQLVTIENNEFKSRRQIYQQYVQTIKEIQQQHQTSMKQITGIPAVMYKNNTKIQKDETEARKKIIMKQSTQINALQYEFKKQTTRIVKLSINNIYNKEQQIKNMISQLLNKNA